MVSSNYPVDCQWLRDTALKQIHPLPVFNMFVLFGNEDCPKRVELYQETGVTDVPVACYDQDENGNLRLSTNLEPQ